MGSLGLGSLPAHACDLEPEQPGGRGHRFTTTPSETCTCGEQEGESREGAGPRLGMEKVEEVVLPMAKFIVYS